MLEMFHVVCKTRKITVVSSQQYVFKTFMWVLVVKALTSKSSILRNYIMEGDNHHKQVVL